MYRHRQPETLESKTGATGHRSTRNLGGYFGDSCLTNLHQSLVKRQDDLATGGGRCPYSFGDPFVQPSRSVQFSGANFDARTGINEHKVRMIDGKLEWYACRCEK